MDSFNIMEPISGQGILSITSDQFNQMQKIVHLDDNKNSVNTVNWHADSHIGAIYNGSQLNVIIFI